MHFTARERCQTSVEHFRDHLAGIGDFRSRFVWYKKPILSNGQIMADTLPWIHPRGTTPYDRLSRDRNDSSPNGQNLAWDIYGHYSQSLTFYPHSSFWNQNLFFGVSFDDLKLYKINVVLQENKCTLSPGIPTTLLTTTCFGFSIDLHVGLDWNEIEEK
jgi:hypothetical protein